MKTSKRSSSVLTSLGGMILCLGAAVLLGAACTCDPGSTNVPPDCPNGTRAASSITIQFDLSHINDIGVDKQIRVNGNRLPNQDNCFQPGSQPALSPAVQITGQGTGTQTINNLQDGNWQVVVQLVGGSSNPQPPQTLTGSLAPGVAHTLVITNNPDGTMKATF